MRCLRRDTVRTVHCVSRRRPLELQGMSIRTALARWIAPNDYNFVALPDQLQKSLGPRLDKEQLRDLLLQLMPDPVAGRPGPVQILSPFESEQQMKVEMRNMEKALQWQVDECERLGLRIAELEAELLTVKPMLDSQREARIATLEAELQKLKS